MRQVTVRSKRSIIGGTAAVVASFLIVGTVGGPASALPFQPTVDSSTTVQVDGTIVVVSGIGTSRDIDRVEPLPDEVKLRTNTGQTVTITGPLTEGIASGSDFSGTLAVPAGSAASINVAVEAALAESDSFAAARQATDLNTEILEASAELSAPLAVVAATITAPPAQATVAPTVHAVDVMVLATNDANPAGGYAQTDSEIDAYLQTLSTYWASQSAGQVAQIVRPLAVKRMAVPENRACDPDLAWDDATAAFGDPDGDTYYTAPGARHLIVIAPGLCTSGTGWGTIGTLNSGGLIWVSHDSLVGLQTMAHEFGHNLGLGHSNAHFCPGQVVEGTPRADGSFSDGCIDDEYMDSYDVMGASFVIGTVTNAQLTALNVTHKADLGALSSADLPTVTRTASLGSQGTTFALNPISNASGVRGLRVVDPRTNEQYYVEYRSGTGMDAGALYAGDIYEELVPGVRVLRDRGATAQTGMTSAVLTIPNPVTPEYRHLALTPGESLTLPSGNLTVKVNSLGATASVTVTLGSGPAAPAVNRIAGDDRYSTAVAISRQGYPGTAPVVYLATGENYPDALSAAPAAAVQGGPLLLTPQAGLPLAVRQEISRLGPAQIVVVGGASAVSESVVNDLKKLAPTVTRLAGTDRFDTGRKVVANAFRGAVASAYVATGMNYPDALSASAAAGSFGIPVVLVNGAAGSVDAATTTLLKTLQVKSLTVVGGPQAVSSGISTFLTQVAPVNRISGDDRFDTSQKVVAAAFTTVDHAYFATGSQFPDALAGAALAGSLRSPLYVVQQGCVPVPIRNDLTKYKTTAVTLFGGPAALSANVAALKGC